MKPIPTDVFPVMSDASPPDIVQALRQIIAETIATADTRTKELIAFQVIQRLDRDPELRPRAIAAYHKGQLEPLAQSDDPIETFLVSAIAAWWQA